ncbi:MAG TPA: cupredoxin domain-containing protein [Stellaceae bacterium]|nr:cupredoxin domain-containing protein [Stellaceae bacterium]
MRPLSLAALLACFLAPGLLAVAAPDWSTAELVNVEMVDYRFIPDHLSFRSGTAYHLHLQNDGKETHEFTAPDFFQAIEVRNPEVIGSYGKEIVVPPGQGKDLYFIARAPGRYGLICADHDWAGMTGGITVQ